MLHFTSFLVFLFVRSFVLNIFCFDCIVLLFYSIFAITIASFNSIRCFAGMTFPYRSFAFMYIHIPINK